MSTLTSSIFDAMSQIATNSANDISRTTTYKVPIIEVVDSVAGLYKVDFQGNSLEAKAINEKITYNVEDIVYMLFPDGDASKDRIILGAATSGDGSAIVDDSVVIREASGNLITENINFSLCTYKDKSYPSIDLGEDFDRDFQRYSEKYRNFRLKCNIKTSMPLEQMRQGNYGFRLYFNAYKDNTIEQFIYTLDTNNIVGDPFNLKEPAPQILDITWPEGYRLNNASLEFFKEGFIHSDEEKEDDIFFSDFSFYAIETLDEEVLQGYKLLINASNGEFFLSGSESTKTLKPTLLSNGRVIDITKHQCYWFSEDATIKPESKYYLQLGGRGWKSLDIEELQSENGEIIYDHPSTIFEKEISKNDVVSSLRYKCVIIYGETVVSSTITIENKTHDIKVSLVSENGTNNVIKDIGSLKLICEVKNNETFVEISDISYNWYRTDRYGIAIEEVDYPFVQSEESLFDIYKYIIEIPAVEIDTLNTFYCSVIVTGKMVGSDTEAEYLIDTPSFVVTTVSNQNYILSILNGNKLYKYDSDGDSPLLADYDGVTTSRIDYCEPLKFQIFKANGSELSEEEYKFCKPKWYVHKNSMITVRGGQLVGDYYLVESNELNYSIRTVYDMTKSNNTVLLSVTFDESELKDTADIKFLKDGEQGTNGSKYAAVIEYKSGDKYYEFGEKDIEGNPIKFLALTDSTHQYKYYDYYTKSILDFNDAHKPEFKVSVYSDGELINNDRIIIEWNFFDTKTHKTIFALSDSHAEHVHLNIENEVIFTENSNNILQVKVTVKASEDNYTDVIYSYYPITMAYYHNGISRENSSYIPCFGGGYYKVLYRSDGTNPKYDSANKDFTITNLIDNHDIDLVECDSWETSNNFNLTKGTLTPKIKYELTNSNVNFIKTKTRIPSSAEVMIRIASLANRRDVIAATDGRLGSKKYYQDTLNKLKQLSLILMNILYSYLVSGIYPYPKELLNIRTNIISLTKQLSEQLTVYKQYCDDNVDFIPGYNYNELYNTWNNKNAAVQTSAYTIRENGLIIGQIDAYPAAAQINSFYAKIQIYIDEINQTIQLINSNLSLLLTIDEGELVKLNEIYNAYKASRDIVIDRQEFSSLYNLLDKIIKNFDTFISFKEYGIETIDKFVDLLMNNYSEAFIEKINGEIDLLNKELVELETRISALSPNTVTVSQPLVITTDISNFSNLNGWDGNRLYIDEDRERYLAAPQIGAGKVEGNKFTGMVMGIASSNSSQSEEYKDTRVGLFGLSKGQETFFLDANTGKAVFGISGKGQIVIDPNSENSGLIYGGNWQSGTSGMCINLTTPEIRWGNGKFIIDSNGKLIATNAELTGSVRSANYSAGSSGFKLDSNGLSISNLIDIGINGFCIGSGDGSLTYNYNGNSGLNVVTNNGRLHFNNSGMLLYGNVTSNIQDGGVFLDIGGGNYYFEASGKIKCKEIEITNNSITCANFNGNATSATTALTASALAEGVASTLSVKHAESAKAISGYSITPVTVCTGIETAEEDVLRANGGVATIRYLTKAPTTATIYCLTK